VAAWARQRDATAVLDEAARQFDRRQWDDVTAAQRQAVETLDGMMHRWDDESTAEPSAPGPGAAQAAAAARQREWQVLAAAAPRLADRQLGICAALGPMAASDLAAWAALQAAIRGQAVSLAETLAAFPVGRAALEGAARAMADAQRHAFAERRGDRAAQAAESALEQLRLIVQVVEASATLPQEPPAEASADGASLPAADRGQRAGATWTAVELRLLLALQERLREATWRWERGVADGTLTPAEAAAEAARLAAEQRRLTQLAAGGAPPLE
jgi:hypothetical protein